MSWMPADESDMNHAGLSCSFSKYELRFRRWEDSFCKQSIMYFSFQTILSEYYSGTDHDMDGNTIRFALIIHTQCFTIGVHEKRFTVFFPISFGKGNVGGPSEMFQARNYDRYSHRGALSTTACLMVSLHFDVVGVLFHRVTAE